MQQKLKIHLSGLVSLMNREFSEQPKMLTNRDNNHRLDTLFDISNNYTYDWDRKTIQNYIRSVYSR